MTTSTEQNQAGIRAILNPRSIAFIGASDDVAKWGGVLLHVLRKFNYAGAIYPVNPKAETIQGLRAYRSIDEIGQPIDLAVISIGVDGVEQAMHECAAAGVRAAMVVTSQFAESGAEGAAKQERVLAVARQAGIAMIGPNCMGVLNANENMALLNSTALVEYFGEIPRGRIGVVSQSGAVVGAMIARAGFVGAGFSSCVSLGNQADLEICDFFDYLVDDPATDVICLYMESARSMERMLAIARRARAAGKPVLITKAGRTPHGQKAVASHTASMAGAYDTFLARCRNEGILVQTDALQMLLTAQALQAFSLPPTAGVAIFSGSGGQGALGSDALSDYGLVPGELSAATRQALSPFFTESNQQLPYDLGAAASGPGKGRPDLLAGSMEPIFADPAVGACVYLMTPQGGMDGIAKLFTELGRKYGKPALLANCASGITENMRQALLGLGAPFFPSQHEAFLTLRDLEWMRNYGGPDAAQEVPALSAQLQAFTQALPEGMQDEDTSKGLLALAGIDVAAGELAVDADAAVSIAGKLGYPVVLKIVADGVTHKSDMGGVQLNLRDADAVRTAFARIRNAAAELPDAMFRGCLVQPMIQAESELMIGTLYDPEFGPFLLLGAGGTLVELMNDTALLPAPASPKAIERAIRGLRCFPLLDGYRGRARADLDKLAQIAHRVSLLAAQLGARMPELDINPLAVRADRAAALDARLRWSPQA
ncbi:acetate--CoA ligase family protein [Variovorax sp. Sphag1AA]|uniref:acetate--CoA ligase family protein n=1 Tax=Variovorax sp. Sphag1AA TaxID=2587027 RepID=UPI00161CE383|nr:acetate--CoA ligase family protein [Variovorax sp. Sphag1AA]MBB3176928.1 acetyl-CoA synthetase (ADP-forming) [Variovorax sp. Sphag1AA]